MTTSQGLRKAVGTPNAIVWIPVGTVIDISSEFGTEIAQNVTIASTRGTGQPGGMLRSTAYVDGHFTTAHAGTGTLRFTGIRLQGPRTDVFDPRKQSQPAATYYAAGFRIAPDSVVIDNCEVFGWTNAGFLLGSQEVPTQSWIHHNQLHHNRMHTLGYPFELYNGTALIEWNYFNANRHSITAFGYATNGYEARFNLVGPDAVQHAFDMHSLCENLDRLSCSSTPRKLAGKVCNVHHNVFVLTSHSAFSIQGSSMSPSRFVANWCAESKAGAPQSDPEGVVYYPDYADVTVTGNRYGKQAATAGQQWLASHAQTVAASAPGAGSGAATATARPNTTAQPTASSTQTASSSTSTGTVASSMESDPLTGMKLTPVASE